jgi:membrane-bound lytic murein transglycosylase D
MLFVAAVRTSASPEPARADWRVQVAALLAVVLSGCTLLHRPAPVAAPAPAEAPVPATTPSPTAPPPVTRKPRAPRGEVAEADKPEWLRGLVLPDLPLRWSPRVTQYLELYKREPRNREILRGWLRRLGAHQAIIEATLARERVPAGLVYVAMIESGFTAGALSSKGAGGFWQFRPDVARGYGLEVSFWVDERRDLEKSTVAAARYLGDLHKRFGNWELALAGYNAGVFAVLDSILRYNTNDYWTLCTVEAGLPWETTEYVPKIFAVGIVDQNRRVFGFDDVAADRASAWDLVEAPAATSFESLATRAGLTSDELAQWNPIYVRRRTPPDRAAVRLRVPAGRGEKLGRLFASVRPADLVPAVIGTGETLARVARSRHVSVVRLRRLNAIADDEEVTPGTMLLVPRSAAKSP